MTLNPTLSKFARQRGFDPKDKDVKDLQNWLIERHKIIVLVDLSENNKFNFKIKVLSESDVTKHVDWMNSNHDYDDYDDALSDGLLMSLYNVK